jgi:uncharacterized membrane protein (UPF0127 family)
MTEEDQGPPEDLAQHGPAGPVEVVTGLSRAYKGVLVGAGFVVVFVLILLWGSNRPANPTFAETTASTVAGPAFAEKKIGVGASCLRVLVADTPEKRSHGLRDRDGMDGFDGMVFEFPEVPSPGLVDHTKIRFTMSGVKFPLAIGFYDETWRPAPAPTASVPATARRPTSGPPWRRRKASCPTGPSPPVPRSEGYGHLPVRAGLGP